MTRRPFCLLITFLFPFTVDAQLDEPFGTSNLNPFVQVHGVPIARSASLLEPGEISWGLQGEMASNFTEDSGSSEWIRIDGETRRLYISFARGFSERFNAGINVQYLRHTGGSLDQFIETWHSVWGLPQGGRDESPQDRLDYHYANLDGPSGSIANSKSGAGDVTVHGAYRLKHTEQAEWAVRAGIKLPVGDARDLLGSEATSVFSSLHMTRYSLFNLESLAFTGSIGLQHIGDGDVLPDIQESWVTYGSGNLAWRVNDRISLKAQVDFHSAYYDSDLRELGDVAVQLVVGGTIRMSESVFIDLSLSEDIVTDRSPDVVFQFGIRGSF